MKTLNSREFGIRALACMTVAVAMAIGGCTEEPQPPPPKPVKSLLIGDPNALAEASFPGRAAAAREANLSFRVSGPLVELPVTVGETVDSGDIVAKIDPNDYQVLVDNAQSLVTAARAAARGAQADYERLSNTQKQDPGATSQRAVDVALAVRDETRAAVSSAEATAQSAIDRLGYTQLAAPFAGEVVETYVEKFETVVALQPILRILDRSSIKMTLSIPGNLIGYADYITNVSVTFDALPGFEIPATVSEIGSEASQVTRTYPLTIVMGQPEGAAILPGMAGQVSIQARLPENADSGVHVPPSALFAGNDTVHSYVWIIENNVVIRREVQIGSLTTTGILVTGGLNPGERIVTAGVSALTDGQKVTVMDTGDSQ